jgi:hypothetical protein
MGRHDHLAVHQCTSPQSPVTGILARPHLDHWHPFKAKSGYGGVPALRPARSWLILGDRNGCSGCMSMDASRASAERKGTCSAASKLERRSATAYMTASC